MVGEEGATDKARDGSRLSPDAQSAEAGGVSGHDATDVGNVPTVACRVYRFGHSHRLLI